jgi:CHAD domain-containing protein
VHAQRLAGESATLEAWREIEVELSSGDPRLLDAVEQRVLAAGARPAGSASKALRVLGPGVIPPWPASSERVKKRSPAGDVVLAYVRRQASVILAVDPRVRRNEPDAVHQMRVALRRLRSTLTAYDRFLDRAGTGELAAEVRWLGTELGSVRDGEVLHARLRAVTEDLPEELVLGPVMARLQTDVLAPTLAGHEQVVSTMSGERYFALLDALDRLCTAPPLLPAAERPAAEVIPEALERALRKVRRALRAAVATPPGPQRDELLHDARKAAKRLRYAAEAAAVLGKHPRRLVGLAERVQEVLGERNDAVVAIDALRREALRAHAAGEAGFTYGLLVGEQRAVIRRLDERLDELVEAAADRRLRPS